MDIPFVSEQFQRAFRNQFPSQTSTGRDLHVSDVVIPVVDFTPTTAGASLPSTLRFCRNGNTVIRAETTSTVGYTDWTNITTGFWGFNVKASGTGNLNVRIRLTTSAGTAILTELQMVNGTDTTNILQDDFIAYVPSGGTINTRVYFTSGSGYGGFLATNLADVNGNLTNPFGYSPQ
jgi:hypothetical protein